MTLLEDLEAVALDYERRAHVAAIPGVQFDLNAIAARLRDHATRMREEMASNGNARYRSTHALEVFMSLERINGGPL